MSNFQKIADKEKWQRLLDRALFKTFFHSLEWESFLEKEFKWLRFERYVYGTGEQQEQALLSLAQYKKAGKEYLTSHPFCEYGGPLHLKDDIDFDKFKQDLLNQFKGQRIKISFHPFILKHFSNCMRCYLTQVKEGIKKGMERTEERESFFFENLQEKSIDELWQAIDRNRKRSIKKAKDNGIEVVDLRTEKELKELYNFYVKNIKEHQNIPYPFSFFRFFFKHSTIAIKAEAGRLRKGPVKILLAKLDGKIIGGNIFLTYQGIVHSFLCGFSQERKSLGVHSLVLWRMLEKAKEQGYQAFDFGATKKNSPLREFKQRWGAEALPILELKNYSGEVKLKKSPLREIWALLPSFLVKMLSPYFLKRRL